MIKYTYIFFILILSSCATKKVGETLTSDPTVEAKKICLNSEGKGRFFYNKEKIGFSYESALEEELGKFFLVLDFPFHGEEKFEVSYQELTEDSNSSFEHKIASSYDGIDPRIVHDFSLSFSEYFRDILTFKYNEKKKSFLEWKAKDKSLYASKKISSGFFSAVASQSNKTYFENLSFELKSKNNFLKIDLILNSCQE